MDLKMAVLLGALGVVGWIVWKAGKKPTAGSNRTDSIGLDALLKESERVEKESQESRDFYDALRRANPELAAKLGLGPDARRDKKDN